MPPGENLIDWGTGKIEAYLAPSSWGGRWARVAKHPLLEGQQYPRIEPYRDQYYLRSYR